MLWPELSEQSFVPDFKSNVSSCTLLRHWFKIVILNILYSVKEYSSVLHFKDLSGKWG